MYGDQFYNMQLAARDNGWTPFSAMENHYNMLYREDERELIPICKQMGASLMPYSPLAWQWAKGVASPIVDATKAKYLDDAAGALEVQLTPEDIALLEECYVPHPIVGAINANPPQGVMLLDEKK